MADVTKDKNVDVETVEESDVAEPAVDVKRLKKDYDKTTRELEKLRAARKQEEDAKPKRDRFASPALFDFDIKLGKLGP